MPSRAAIALRAEFADAPPLLDIADVATLTKRSEKAVRRLREKGQGPPFKWVAGRLLCTRADFLAWLEAELAA